MRDVLFNNPFWNNPLFVWLYSGASKSIWPPTEFGQCHGKRLESRPPWHQPNMLIRRHLMSCTGNLNSNRAPGSHSCFKFKLYYNLFVKDLLTVWSLGHISEQAAELITSPRCLGISSLTFCNSENKTGEEWQPAKLNAKSDTSAISKMATENIVPPAFCLFFKWSHISALIYTNQINFQIKLIFNATFNHPHY